MKNPKKQSEPKPFSREQMHMDNERLMEHINSMNFQSVDEINDYFEKNINGKRIDEVVPKKKGPKSNVEKSDDLVYKAYECENENEKIKLLKDAIKLNPENVRAICMMGDYSTEIEEAVLWYKQAMDIGAAQLGEDFFKENKGHFWGLINTRPFMTAKMQYAYTLSLIEEREDDAITQMEELLKLNPYDNQGIRYKLAVMYLLTGKKQNYLNLHKDFKENSTFWNYNFLAYLLSTEGATSKAEKAFKKALDSNSHVFEMFVGYEEIENAEIITSYSPGSPEEAYIYLKDGIEVWIASENTLKNLTKLIKKLTSS